MFSTSCHGTDNCQNLATKTLINLLHWYLCSRVSVLKIVDGLARWHSKRCIHWGFNLAVHVMPQNLSLVVYVSAGGCYQRIQLHEVFTYCIANSSFLHNPELHQLHRNLYSRLFQNCEVFFLPWLCDPDSIIYYSLKLDDHWHSASESIPSYYKTFSLKDVWNMGLAISTDLFPSIGGGFEYLLPALLPSGSENSLATSRKWQLVFCQVNFGQKGVHFEGRPPKTSPTGT